MARPSPSFSLSSIFNSNTNPNLHNLLINSSITISFNLHRTFKTSPIHSNLQPPPQQYGGEGERSFSVSTGEFFIGVASRLINFIEKKEVSSSAAIMNEGEMTKVDDGERFSTVIEDSLQPPLPPPQQCGGEGEKSFSVATGEFFSGVASRLLSLRKNKEVSSSTTITKEDGTTKFDNGERISTAIEDSLEPEIVWEQREKDVEEEKRRKTVTSPGFSFSAAGLLFPYHLGVAQFLIDHCYIKETTPLAGSSAGALICAAIASGSNMRDTLQATKVLAEDCRLRGTAFRLGALLRDVLQKMLPEDAHIRCNGRVRVAVTQIGWRPRGLLIDHFDSREDLINALFTSSFIPGYLAPRPATMFRNQLCVDGALTLFMPPTSASQTVCVSAFPASTLRMKGIGISPDCNPENRLSTRQLLNWALEPADDNVLDKFYEFGYSDAAIWAHENPVDVILHEEIPQG